MSKALEMRYRAKGEILYPNRSRRTIARPLDLNRALRRRNGLVVGYAGNLAYGYTEGLEQLLPVFRRHGITLRVYSFMSPRFIGEPRVEYAGALSPEELWPQVQKECDVVILPYCSPEHGHEKLYSTHFPSKLPEYLALGMPVVISGPDYATGVQWGIDHPEACAVVQLNSQDKWDSTLRRLIEDADYRCALAQGAAAAANAELAPERIELLFRSRLNDVAKSNGF
jgi:glycosyltransferase involved in cell wall biosynthesis